jgi:hypothetical protein
MPPWVDANINNHGGATKVFEEYDYRLIVKPGAGRPLKPTDLFVNYRKEGRDKQFCEAELFVRPRRG